MNQIANVAKRRVLPVLAAATALVGNAAHAAVTIDLTEVTGTITSGITTITTLGVAVLSLVVVVKLFKWVKGAM